jgi:hypothetical protein
MPFPLRIAYPVRSLTGSVGRRQKRYTLPPGVVVPRRAAIRRRGCVGGRTHTLQLKPDWNIGEVVCEDNATFSDLQKISESKR